MFANNETGVIQPIRQLSERYYAGKALFMSDATQACGKIRVDVEEEGIDLLPFSSHKLYGPKGCGALYVRRKNPRAKLLAQIHGGGHENGEKRNTQCSRYCRIWKKPVNWQSRMWEDNSRISVLRTQLEKNLLDLGGVAVQGNTRHRLPNTSNLSFTGCSASVLIKSCLTLPLQQAVHAHPLCQNPHMS